MRRAILFIVGCCFSLQFVTHARAGACVEVALVLAIDASSSVTDEEFGFQKRAVAETFRDAGMADVVRRSRAVAVAVVVWGDQRVARQVLNWRVVKSAQEAIRFADDVERLPRAVHGNTDIGSGLWTALDMFDQGDVCANKLVVNLSGDGRESRYPRRRTGPSIRDARVRASAMGVTINGLVLTKNDPGLDHYYRTQVISGPHSFVEEVTGSTYSELAEAMKRKLLREVEGLPLFAQERR